MAGFTWTKPRLQAAILVAEDELSNQDIADAVGVSRQALDKWKAHPDFAAQVAHHVEDLNRAMTRLAIAKKYKRLKVLDDLHAKALSVIEERSEDAGLMAFAGGETGLLVKQLKVVGSGPMAREVEEAAVDTALMREIRALHEQAAKELGQWSEKAELNIKGLTFADLYALAADAGASPVGRGAGG